MPSQQLTKLPLSLIRDTRTRTTPGSSNDNGILPGPVYHHPDNSYTPKKKKKDSSRASASGGRRRDLNSSHSSSSSTIISMGRFWSPYARPPRRSKKLVIVWVGAFVLAGLFTWWVSTRHGELARSYGEVLMSRPGKVPVGE